MTFEFSEIPEPLELLDESAHHGSTSLLPEILDVYDLATLLRVTPEVALEELEAGKIPGAQKVGGEWRIKREVMLKEMFEGVEHSPDVMTVSEAAVMLRCSEKKIREAVEMEHIPYWRSGNVLRFSKVALMSLLATSSVKEVCDED